MKKLNYPLLFIFTLLIACKMPKADQTIAMMDRYWSFYNDKNYDSLKTFYLSNGDNVGGAFWKAFSNMREKNGEVKNIQLTSTTVGQSFENGETINLIYQVEYDKAMINHELTFRKDEKGVFRIAEHECTQ